VALEPVNVSFSCRAATAALAVAGAQVSDGVTVDGFHASHEQVSPRVLLDATVLAEQAGFGAAMYLATARRGVRGRTSASQREAPAVWPTRSRPLRNRPVAASAGSSAQVAA